MRATLTCLLCLFVVTISNVLAGQEYRVYQLCNSLKEWPKQGKLTYDCMRVSGHDYDAILYHYNNRSINIQYRIFNINEMFSVEIQNRESALSFLHSNMSDLIVFAMTRHGEGLLTEDRFNGICKTIDRIDKSNDAHDGFSKIASKYISKTSADIFRNGTWRIHLNTINIDGAITTIDASGSVYPLTINRFVQEIAEPKGTGPVFSECD